MQKTVGSSDGLLHEDFLYEPFCARCRTLAYCAAAIACVSLIIASIRLAA